MNSDDKVVIVCIKEKGVFPGIWKNCKECKCKIFLAYSSIESFKKIKPKNITYRCYECFLEYKSTEPIEIIRTDEQTKELIDSGFSEQQIQRVINELKRKYG